MKQKLLAIIVLLVIASVGGYYLNKSGKLRVNKPQQIEQPDRVEGEKGVAPKVIPTNLIPAKSAVQENYEVSTDKYKQNTVNLETLDSVKTVYDYYLKTLENDYRIHRKSYAEDNASIYAYAKDGSHELNVVIYKDFKTSKTEVVLSYVNMISK